jgi:GntR family transcriptional regulator/MocR family aminotransferase
MFPGLRISYLVVPAPLIEAFQRAQLLHGRYPAILPQLALCDFIESGHFARHIRRMVVCYQERRAVLMDALNEYFGNSIEVTPGQSGLCLSVWWPCGKDAQMISTAARRQSLHVEPMTTFQIRNPVRSGALLGFAGFGVPALRESVRRLAKIVESDIDQRLSA